MRININDGQTFERIATDIDLAEAIDRTDDEYSSTEYELSRYGRAWIGGGAAALFYLTLNKDTNN